MDSKLTGLTVLPDDTLGVNIFPAGVSEKAVYICATKVSAPKQPWKNILSKSTAIRIL